MCSIKFVLLSFVIVQSTLSVSLRNFDCNGMLKWKLKKVAVLVGNIRLIVLE
ncbi:unnamed protein product [Strongylus vulgaris]|uniref:Uncharacterized protein n=1 Tax=Strongylus vulgaris TaxID=40348 RepID=A0A3P7JWJ1_STRVU|nr:unnamed protein product [Strongylus vulgaris]